MGGQAIRGYEEEDVRAVGDPGDDTGRQQHGERGVFRSGNGAE